MVLARVTLSERRTVTALVDPHRLAAATVDGAGRVGVQDAETGRWQWVSVTEIRSVEPAAGSTR